MTGSFDEQAAAGYEAWYATPEGERADRLEKAVLRRLLERFSGGETILEVGCGTGHFTRWLGQAGWSAVGLDLSGSMLKHAEALDGVSLVRGDALRLPFADGAFDVAAMVTTLEFLDRPGAGLVEALRVARHGVLLGVLNRCSLLAARRRLNGLFRATIYDQARFYTVGDLKRLLRSNSENDSQIAWLTTLFPDWWPWPDERLPWGGFAVVALQTPD